MRDAQVPRQNICFPTAPLSFFKGSDLSLQLDDMTPAPGNRELRAGDRSCLLDLLPLHQAVAIFHTKSTRVTEVSYSGHLCRRFQPKHQSTHQLSSRQYLQAPRVHCLPGLWSQKCRQGRIPPFWFVRIAVRHCCPRASRWQTWLVLQIQCKIQLHNA